MSFTHLTDGAGVGTTSSFDSTGANLIILVTANSGSISVSDSKGNTYSTAISKTQTLTNFIFYCLNPTVGTGHTATITGAFGSIVASCFSGAAAASVLDQTNSFSAATTGTSSQPGSITPSTNNQLIFVGGGNSLFPIGSTYAISGCTIAGQVPFGAGVNYSSVGGWVIQTSAAAINPTLSWTGLANPRIATIASFKAATGGASSQVASYYTGGQNFV